MHSGTFCRGRHLLEKGRLIHLCKQRTQLVLLLLFLLLLLLLLLLAIITFIITLILLIVISSLVLFSLVAVVAVIVIYLLQVTWSDKMYLYNAAMWQDDRNDQMQLCNEQHGLTLCLNTAAGEGTSSSTQGASNTQARNTPFASGESI